MENQSVNLSLSDLVTLKNAVSVACERGAFRAEEMSSVGGCYDHLAAWLAQMTAGAENTGESPQPQGE